MKQKIYCGYCKYFDDKIEFEICEHPKNIRKVINAYTGEEIEYIDFPYNINKNHDCKFFKRLSR